MPTSQHPDISSARPTEPAQAPAPHGDLDCMDAESLLAESEAECARLRAEVATLNRLLTNARAQKNQAIDEAVTLRARP